MTPRLGQGLLRLGWGRTLPMILQAEAAECGIACIAMVMGWHGHMIDLGSMRRRHAISLKGATMRTLTDVAAASGLSARALRLELADLSRLRLPCILHWGMNHFVVLKSVGRRSVVIHDPARGARAVPIAEVAREFTGVALELQPADGFVRKDEDRGLRLGELFEGLAGLGPSFAHILALSVCIEVVALLMPIGSQVVVDEVIVSSDRDLLTVLAVGMGLLLLVQALVGVARTWAIMVMGARISEQWNAGLLRHLVRLPLDWFENRHVGDVISRVGALGAIQKALTADLVQGVLDGVMSIGMGAMLFVYGGWLGWLAVAATGSSGLLRALSLRSYRRRTEEAVVCEAKQSTHLIETVRGIAAVKMLGLGERRRAVWLNHLVDTLNARFRLQSFDLAFGRATEFVSGADRLAMIVLGAGMVMDGRMTLGALVAFLSYKDQFSARVAGLIGSAFQLRMLSVQSGRLGDIVLTEPEDEAASLVSRGPAPSAAAGLRAEALSFRYGPQEPWIFRGVSLAIEPGRTVAITGASGCGKTTFLKTLMGLLRASEGALLLDGVDLRSMGAAAWRARIAGVLQDDALFAGSLADNIACFDSRADMGWIEECAARAAILDDVRRMPMGFESLVGDMGGTLSGGQRQRIMLARAMYRRPAILFLDEATSHLDEATEALIAASLRELRMTRVIAAHRPATVAQADLVIPFATFARSRIEEAQARTG